MTKKVPKQPCGKCLKNVTKNSVAVLCSGCVKWYHCKCLDNLTDEEYLKVKQKHMKWTCSDCNSTQVDENVIKEDADAVNEELTKELRNQDIIIKTLSDDLNQLYEEIKELKNHNRQLEKLVLNKEETIILLEREIEKIKDRPTNMRRNIEIVNISGALSVSTPVTTNSERIDRDRSWPRLSLEARETFASVRYKKSNRDRTKHKIKTACPQENNKGCESLNRFEALYMEEETIPKAGSKNVSVETGLRKNKNKKQMIWVYADSHGRNLSWEIRQLEKTYEATGMVRPGSRTKDVVEMYKNLNEVKSDDVVVVIAGSNDVAKNESSEAIREISSLLQLNAVNGKPTSKIVLVDLPKRHDLVEWSCVNKEINKTNLALKELCNKQKNITLVNASKADRMYHTRHGMHLNVKGKKWLAEEIVKSVKRLIEDSLNQSAEEEKTSEVTFSENLSCHLRNPAI